MYNAVLAIHIIAAIGLFLAIGFATMMLGRARRAASAAEVVKAARGGSLAAYINVVLLLIVFIAAGYLVGKKWSWSQGWVSAAFVGVVVAALLSLVAIAPRLTALGRAAQAEGTARPSRAVQLEATHPVLWGAAQVIALLYVGIVILMFAKPSGAVSALILIVAVLLGIGATMPARARYRALSAGGPSPNP
jgi:hypothetical protein